MLFRVKITKKEWEYIVKDTLYFCKALNVKNYINNNNNNLILIKFIEKIRNNINKKNRKLEKY